MFSPATFRQIEKWSLAELASLPEGETDLFEYKSSAAQVNDLAGKIARAASGFWNSGGGLFVAGVDGQGQPDGGLPLQIGKQDLRDWADQAISACSPLGPYSIAVVTGAAPAAGIHRDHGVLLIAFGASSHAPHMAGDKRYYIRVGAHTVPATHFLVEAIRAQRGLQKPWLECLLRHVTVSSGAAVQLSIVAVSDAPALDVQICAEPIDGRPSGYPSGLFPKRVPLIDRLNPFVINLNSVSALQDAAFLILLSYTDVRGRKYSTSHVVDARDQLGPVLC